jgi:hypothetical protein
MTPEQVKKLKEIFSYDKENGILTRLTGQYAGKMQMCTSNGYVVTYVFGKNVKAHKVIWAMHKGEWPNSVVDHIDGDGLNNRIENLRLASMSGNAQNRRSTLRKSRSPKGVRQRRDRESYFRAEIYVNNQRIHLGCFKSQDEAAHAYNKAAIQYHGEFACLNPVGENRD